MSIFTRATASKSPKDLLATERRLQLRALGAETLATLAYTYATSLPRAGRADGAAQNIVPKAELVVDELRSASDYCTAVQRWEKARTGHASGDNRIALDRRISSLGPTGQEAAHGAPGMSGLTRSG
jgi:hypothetical protein